ncbi:MAG: ABC transporter ATP-binding protein [Acetobacteraceae bacterium]|nr:ABC transporter ATP-binding protein [Acetobacteraceae bacterium]
MLQCRGLAKRYGSLVATARLDLDVAVGELHALIGPNGAGKSTLIGLLAGQIRHDEGRILLAGADIGTLSATARARRGLARSFQVTSVLPEFTACENVALAVQARAGHSFRFFRNAGQDCALIGPAKSVLERVGLGTRANVPAKNLAHGEQRQLELAMALATEPRMLLLDEPMAGLGPSESEAMTRLLASLKGRVTILLVEHDMDAVFALADRVTVLVGGRALATGAPAAIRADPAVRAAYLGEDDAVFAA